MTQQIDFQFKDTELRQLELIIRKTGSWMCAVIDWAERRQCKMNAQHVQCMAQIATRMEALGGADKFIEQLKSDSARRQSEAVTKKINEIALLPDIEPVQSEPIQSNTQHPNG